MALGKHSVSGTLDFKHNTSATTAPTATDDKSKEYIPGSLWTDVSNDTSYICVDNTIGAAVWNQIGGSGSIGITSVVEDTSPQLGGDLDVNGFSLVSVTNGDISLIPHGTGIMAIKDGGDALGTHRLHLTEDTNGASISGVALDMVFSNTTGSILDVRKARGTVATKTIVSSGDVLGQVRFIGYDGDSWEPAGSIRVEVGGTPGDGDMPGLMVLAVTPDGSTTPENAIEIGYPSKVVYFAFQPQSSSQTLTDGATINWDVSQGQKAEVTLGGNRILAAPTNIVDGATYVLFVTQDGTGSRTLTWNAAYKFPGGNDPVLTTAPGATDIITFIGHGGVLYGVASLDFS